MAKKKKAKSLPAPKAKRAMPAGSNKLLEALSAFSRRDPFSPGGDFHAYYQEVSAKENARGAAILLAANVENNLEYAVQSRLLVHNHKELFGFESPIGTFDSKIRLAYALEIIGPVSHLNLTVIKAIRNAFAHGKVAMKFEDEAVSNVCGLLAYIPQHHVVSLLGIEFDDSPDKFQKLKGRERYRAACQRLSRNLYGYGFHGYAPPSPSPPPVWHQSVARPTPLP